MARKSKLNKTYEVEYENGHYIFKLNSLMDEKKVTKNSIIVRKNIDFKTMNKLIQGDLTRIDLGVIAKLCNDLGCGITDIVEYVNNDNQ